MLFEEVSQEIYEAKLVYARKGRSIVRKYRCGSGRLKGKTVSKPGKCFAPVNKADNTLTNNPNNGGLVPGRPWT